MIAIIIDCNHSSCKRYSHSKNIITHMIASTQITNTAVFAFIAVLVFKLLQLSTPGLFR